MEHEPLVPPRDDDEAPELSEESRLVPDENERHDTDEFVPDGLEDDANVTSDEDVAAEEVLRRVADAGSAF